MHVLFVNSLFGDRSIGGAETSLGLVAAAHVRAGGRATVVSLGDASGGDRPGHDGIRHVEIALANGYWPWDGRPRGPAERLAWHARDAWNREMARRLARCAAAIGPDLVQFHNLKGFSGAVVPAIRRLGLPTVQVCHDYYPACSRCVMQRGGSPCNGACRDCRLFAAPRKAASRRHDAVVAVGRTLLDRLLAAGCFAGVDRRRVIANPVVAPPGPVARPTPSGANGPLRLGFLGRLDPVKGLETAFRAMRRLAPGTATLTVAGRGDPPYEAGLRRAAAGLPVQFAGHLPPAALFAAIDLLLVPSIWAEPFGRITVEARMHRVPVAASAIGGSLDLIEPERSGFLFPSGDADALAALIARLAADRARLSAVAKRATIGLERHRPEAAMSAYRALWRDVLARPRQGAEANAATPAAAAPDRPLEAG